MVQFLLLNRPNKLPAQILTDELPNLVLIIQLISVFQKGETLEIIVQLQKFAEFIENIGI